LVFSRISLRSCYSVPDHRKVESPIVGGPLKSLSEFLLVYPELPLTALLIAFLFWHWQVAVGDRNRTEWFLVVTSLSIPLNASVQLFVHWFSAFRPLKEDLYIYHIDSFCGQPSFRIAQVVWAHPWLKATTGIVYELLPVAILGAFAANLWLRSMAETIEVARAFVLNLFALPLFYYLFPVSGPVFAFQHFPEWPAKHIVPHLIAIDHPSNGMPSGHASTAMLIFWFLRHWKWGQITGVMFLVLTLASTLGTGQHYVFDLICAIPYSVAVVRVTRSRPAKREHNAAVSAFQM